MNTILYYILYTIQYLYALLPFRVLYFLSDILYTPIYHIIRYRRGVVKQNLRRSFPEKTEKELKDIEKKFYRHFCDYLLETVKLLHISDKEMQSRITFNNVDLVKDLMKDGTSSIMFLGHYGNWEWVTSLNLMFDEDTTLGQIYKPLRNKAFDRLFLKIRSRFKSIGIPKNNTLRAMIGFKREKRKVLIGFISDQAPSRSNVHHWTNFLNQDTSVFTGVERIARQTGFSVTYLDITKIGRGRYSCDVKLITDDPQNEPEFAITEKYFKALEETIIRNPPYWLWTHKRWKYKRADFDKA